MKITKFVLALVTVSMVLFLVGCGDNAPSDLQGSPTGGDENLDLNADFGGYETTDEAPAFGIDDLMKSADDGVPAADAVADDPTVVALGAAPTTNAYVVRLAWGMLEGDSTVATETDWSGSISVDRGAVIIERIIRFEPGDSIVRPRVDRTSIELASKTAPHYDGLLITVLDSQEDPLATAENVLHISLGDFETSYTLPQLGDLDEVVDVDAAGNQFSIDAFLLGDFPCGNGVLSGQWRHTSVNGGDFAGRWASRDGQNRGFVRGQWGVNEEGQRVFFGKYILADGTFGGLLRGHWGYAESRASGVFRGAWYGNNDIQGMVRGVWRHEWRGTQSNPVDETVVGRHGFFHGRWIQACDPSEVTDDFAGNG